MKAMARTSIALALLSGLAATAHAQETSGALLTREAQAAITPAMALQMLEEGNARFAAGNMLDRDYTEEARQTAAGQFPFAAIVSCLDSRIPPEIVFDRGIGDLFVARVAGNFVDDGILGSLEFATRLSGAKIVVVMGHTDCGAVMGACDGAQMGLLTATLANINPAVNAVQGDYSPRSSENREFVQAVADMHVTLTRQKMLDRSVVLRELVDSGEILVVGAMYDLSTGKITFVR